MKILFDMASVLKVGMYSGDCPESYVVDFEGKEVEIRPASHGHSNALDYMLEVIDKYKCSPEDCILVFEGMDTKKRRLAISSDYKKNRDKSAPEFYKEYNAAKEMLLEDFRKVGAICVEQKMAEGDDTLAFLVDKLDEEMLVVSGDGDLTVLAGENRHGAVVTVLTGWVENKLPDGVYDARHITLYKSLVGDTSDSIVGVPRFGKESFRKLAFTYLTDGLDEIDACLQRNDVDTIAKYADANKCKLLNSIVSHWNSAVTSYKLARLYPEWVNTRYNPLKVIAGMVCDKSLIGDDRLHKFAQNKVLVTAENYEVAMQHLQLHIRWNKVVALDFETYPVQQSTDWLAQQGKDDGVDPLGHKLAGFSITYGRNSRQTIYVSVGHVEQPGRTNVTMSQARKMLEITFPYMKAVHNAPFELTIASNEFAADEDGPWFDQWKDKGAKGFIPNVDDTLIMSSYVDENAMQRNLKALSRNVLNYQQVEFNDMRTFRIGEAGKPYPGGVEVEKFLTEQVLENGKPVLLKSGKPKVARVKQAVPVLDENGQEIVTRKRRFVDGEWTYVNEVKSVSKDVTYREVRYSMNELPAEVVFDYGCDDTICTKAYYNYAKLMMLIDEHFHVYRQVEVDALYLHTLNFKHGFKLDVGELVKQRTEDGKVREEQEKILHNYLIGKGWEGTVLPRFDQDISPSEIKFAYATVMGISLDEPDEDDEEEGEVDPVMGMRVRTPEKILAFIRENGAEGSEIFCGHLEALWQGNEQGFNNYVAQHFTGKPSFKYSNKNLCKLLYDTMGLTVQVRNKLTDNMRAKGHTQGAPKADTLAIDYAIIEAKEKGMVAELEVLNALKVIAMVNTRFGLFYNTYLDFIHWSTNKIHSSHRQCHANTRRASSAAPNLQQWPAHGKVKGYDAPFRRTVVPHKADAVIVSLDFNAQELRSIADDSKDPNMLACYVGDDKKDMHSITGAAIWKAREPAEAAEAMKEFEGDFYKAFKSMESTNPVKYGEMRSLGKKVNFSTEYGAQAPKLAQTLMISESDAQLYIDAREESFPVAKAWKEKVVVQQAHEQGFVRSRLGAKRHLAEALDSGQGYIASKAERQAVNFRIQGSCAEQTKLAEARMWQQDLFTGNFDAICIGPIHDEVVSSVALKDLFKFLKLKHECMCANYAGMEVPVVSSIAVGPNFYDQVELGESSNIVDIVKALEAQKVGYEKRENKFMADFCDKLLNLAKEEM